MTPDEAAHNTTDDLFKDSHDIRGQYNSYLQCTIFPQEHFLFHFCNTRISLLLLVVAAVDTLLSSQ